MAPKSLPIDTEPGEELPEIARALANAVAKQAIVTQPLLLGPFVCRDGVWGFQLTYLGAAQTRPTTVFVRCSPRPGGTSDEMWALIQQVSRDAIVRALRRRCADVRPFDNLEALGAVAAEIWPGGNTFVIRAAPGDLA